MKAYLIDGINPEPWESPSLGLSRAGGKLRPIAYKSDGLRAYQEAVKEEAQKLVADDPFDELPPFSLHIWFWRNVAVADYGGKKKSSANYADTTNLQKSFEDALQDVFFDNDRLNQDVRSRLVDQGPDVEPAIFFTITHCIEYEFEGWVHEEIDKIRATRAPIDPDTSNVLTRDVPF